MVPRRHRMACCSLIAAVIGTAALALVVGCTGARNGSPSNVGQVDQVNPGVAPAGPAPSGQGQLAIALTDAPNPDVSSIVVSVAKVTAHSTSAGWVTVSPAAVSTSTPLAVDLLTLQSSEQELGLLNLPPGTITQIRLYVSQDDNYVVLTSDKSKVPLKVPSGSQSGVKIQGPWDITACNQTSITLDFDGKKSIWYHPTGQGDEWILRPVIHTKKSDSAAVGCSASSDGGAASTPGSTTCDADHPCAAGDECSSAGVCQGPEGASCVTGAECISSSCDSTNRCGPGPVGTSCTSAADCLTTTCTNGTCAKGGGGASCSAASDCVSGTCTDGSCTAPTAAGGAGAPCSESTAATDCLSATCVNGQCAQGGQGAPCNSAQDCQEGMSCLSGSCGVQRAQ